jgi:hypothetical protein
LRLSIFHGNAIRSVVFPISHLTRSTAIADEHTPRTTLKLDC